jgi:hypothetical protein
MKKIISMMAMAMVLLWSCQEKEDLGTVASGSIALAGSVTDGQIIAGPEGGEFQVNVTSSEDWRVSGLADWVTLSSESGKSGQALTFTVLPNESEMIRTATFKVFAADAVQAVEVTQHPSYMISLVSADTLNVSADAALVNVNLLTNIEEIDIDFGGAESWVKVVEMSDAFGKRIIQLEVARSKEFVGRNTTLTFGSVHANESVKVEVNQAQRDTAFVVGEQKHVQGLEALSLDLVIKSNVDVKYSLPAWLTETLGEATEKDETGLKSQAVTLTADASEGSRSATLNFKKGNTVVGTFFVKQQNPNPVFTEIEDENLRYLLESKGWIIPDEGIRAEILATGLNATSLVVGSTDPNAYSEDPINSVKGLEAFPKLESLTLGSLTISKIDVSEFPVLNELKLINLQYVEEVNTGSTAVADVTNLAGMYTYTTVPAIVVKGDNIENVDFSASGYYMWYESLKSIDVTGCPKLKTVNVYRYEPGWGDESSLDTLYMTAEQAETVQVTKRDKVQIVVK